MRACFPFLWRVGKVNHVRTWDSSLSRTCWIVLQWVLFMLTVPNRCCMSGKSFLEFFVQASGNLFEERSTPSGEHGKDSGGINLRFCNQVIDRGCGAEDLPLDLEFLGNSEASRFSDASGEVDPLAHR